MRMFMFVFAFAVAFRLFGGPKNIVLFIGDGMSLPQRTLAEAFSRQQGTGPLAMNALPTHVMTCTSSSSSFVTDSAASATAIACGEKTYNGAMGVDVRTNRLVSVAELAKVRGMKVGIVTTVTINHATPSGFFGHRAGRGESYGLALDLLASGFDYFAGGGASGHKDKANLEYRGDIYELAPKAGYRLLVQDYAAFKALRPGCGKVWYVAKQGVMPFAIDAAEWEGVPTLAELTSKGLELLSDGDKGFFMMVEGGKIDHAGHANDSATNVRETIAFDEAVKVAIDFQKCHPDTLILVTGDHETGGLTLKGGGFAALAGQKCSVEAVGSFVKQNKVGDFAELKPFIVDNFKFAFTDSDWAEMSAAFCSDVELAKRGQKENEAYDAVKISKFPAVLKRLISEKCGLNWSTGSHTALPVLTTAVGPGAEEFRGLIENSDIAKRLKSMLR